MPNIFYWIICIAILFVFDLFIKRKKGEPNQIEETPEERRRRVIKSLVLGIVMVAVAGGISYFVRG